MCLPLCLNLELPAQQEKKVEVAAAALKWSQTAVLLKWSQTAAVILGRHMQGVLACMVGLDDFSNWGYRCCHKEHL